jgi:S1/P1 Nuclease
VKFRPRSLYAATLLCVWLGAAPCAHAWGCKGHEIVAFIAESHLNAHAKEMVLRILAASPVDPTLARYCPLTGDPIADSSTWADDERKVRPETGPWHFIDIPRGASAADLSKFCPAATSCVTASLADQLRILRDPNATAQARADALRFLIHFVGDIHQPLHAITNNDLGGNCVPVDFFGHAPVQGAGKTGSYNPNLHEVWDVEIIERFSPDQTPQQVASTLEEKFKDQLPKWQTASPNFDSWAWQSHELAEKISYGKLPQSIPIATPQPESACSDPGVPVVNPPENIEEPYQDASAPVVQEQLARAGARLAGLLNSLWP